MPINNKEINNKGVSSTDFNLITLKLASPEKILEWSHGEVKKPETINYRTQRSEKDGLFDEKIFGPDKDYECYCGKYKGIRYKGITCEKCGVEITRSIVRRDRMGHIELAVPVSHIWFLKSIPSRIGLILDIPAADLRRVIYFAGYIVVSINEEEKKRILEEVETEYKVKVKNLQSNGDKERIKELVLSVKKDIENIQLGVVFDEITYNKYSLKYGAMFEAKIGAEAIYNICKQINLEKLKEELEKDLVKAGSIKIEKVNKRLGLIESLIRSKSRPEWMFLTRVPVIPPALRPMVVLGGGRHATSDVNDLYRRVINRNNRLKKLQEINAPDVILRNEKRILQEAVDSLIDNSIKYTGSSSVMSQAQRRPLKSLSDNLKGKQGLFRQNLLGKRVDYSGRSVIVVGPDLNLDECGLPKHMALELFRPFVISRILKDELAHNIKWAGRLIEEESPEVWAILEEVIKDKYVLLNRAPTLHRLGIQAFRPLLIEGMAIQVHPLVCSAFNADFDGDTMAVHVPLTNKAQAEAREIMAADKNILKPGTGSPIVDPKMDMALGCYWMTKVVEGDKRENKFFSSVNEAITAYDFGVIDYGTLIKVLPSDSSPRYAEFKGEVFETTVGRLLFNSILPKDYPYINDKVGKKEISQITNNLIKMYGMKHIAPVLGKIKDFGFKYATKSGITWGIDNVTIPKRKYEIVDKTKEKSNIVWSQYNDGLLTQEERRRKNIELWHTAKDELESLIPETLDQHGSAYNMWISGARGSLGQFTQMAGMRGLIQNTAGETIETPVISCLKEGLTPIEYFTTTHGSRKGLADTALNTSKAGYLTRKLFDVAQDVVITESDCGTKNYINLKKEQLSGIEISLARNIRGRVLAKKIEDKEGKVLFKKGHLVSEDDAKTIEVLGIESVDVRSPMTCGAFRGVCQKCYGTDFGTNELVDLGEAVGTIAAQAIGEPGTQLTMRTFHTGGTASVGGDITQGLPRVEEIFERRTPKSLAIISKINGRVADFDEDSKERKLIILPDLDNRSVGAKGKQQVAYVIPYNRTVLVKIGERVKKGDILTDGSADIAELFRYAGKEKAQEYIIRETIKIYELQGASTSRKHIEVIIKQMMSRKKIKSAGGTTLAVGSIVEDTKLNQENEKARKAGLEEARGISLVLGITETSLTRESFLSSVSFQNTTKMLINASIEGAVDELVGLKENIIIGRLVPAGSGFKGSEKWKMIEEINEPDEDDRE